MEDEKLDKLLKEKLNEHRYMHVYAVAKRAKELATRFGADPEKAYFAGLVHDICKCESVEMQLQRAKSGCIIPDDELKIPPVYHQYAGAYFLEKELGVRDEDILSAVRWHTTGRKGQSLLEKIIYLADLSGEDRSFEDIELARKEIDAGIDRGMAYCTERIRKLLLDKGFTLSRNAEECYTESINNTAE